MCLIINMLYFINALFCYILSKQIGIVVTTNLL